MDFRNFLFISMLLPSLGLGTTYSGGLQFTHAPSLVIDQQNVTINPEKITVAYTLRNTSDNDIYETLVFPLPLKNEDNYKQFSVSVNQIPVQYLTIQRAISSNGQDISSTLKSLGLPYNPIAAMHSIDASRNRDSINAKLRAQNLMDKKEEAPLWNVQTFYYWQQKFPAHTAIHIEQNYKPVAINKNVKITGIGSYFKLPVKMMKQLANMAIHWTLEDQTSADELRTQLEKYNPQVKDFCPTPNDYKALLLMGKTSKQNTQIETHELNYSYTNSDAWCAPINRFTLRIESPANMLPMLCWHSEFKRPDEHTLVFEAENYVPVQNISVLYVER